ncbi:MAG: hypothetical protein VBE63_08415 [Lamprobacter sp.]|uniref:hypothetical protein n=1 Tax=Lamprobacter sp. TaxID=3100796 RepID=UPI002B263B08|nr:hypothetical protein [Lamprobacter sp.]MEA3639953.1 hypothetical protein [Lamprobacter sp.]
MAKILDTLASAGLVSSVTGTGGARPKVDIPKTRRADVAVFLGVKESALKSLAVNPLPDPYNKEFAELVKAHGLVRTEYYKATMPFGNRGATADTKTASGDRFIVSSVAASAEFGSKFTVAGSQTAGSLYDALDAARQTCGMTIDQRVQDAINDQVLDAQLQPYAKYVTSTDILAGWVYTPVTLKPMARTDVLEGMFLPPNVAKNIEAHMEAQAAEQLKFGQQQTILETVEYLKTMTKNLTKLSKWYATQKGRRPAIYDSLVENVQHSLGKLRDYAMPETEAGSRIVDLVDELSEALDLTAITADDLKKDPQLASKKAKDAEKAAGQLSDALGSIWDEPMPEHIQRASQQASTADLDDLLTSF